jgi:hypothetical protein
MLTPNWTPNGAFLDLPHLTNKQPIENKEQVLFDISTMGKQYYFTFYCCNVLNSPDQRVI